MPRTAYILKLFDQPLVRFSANPESSDPEISITQVYEGASDLLPLGMDHSDKGLRNWIEHRAIPKNRAYVNAFLAKSGLSANRPMAIAEVSRGLSLNDSYWIQKEGFDKSFDKVNLYENSFSRILSEIAFTGYGSNVRSTFRSSPEFTTNGMLPKTWRRKSGVISLWKGGTSGFSNSGFEPYSEFYASQIAEVLEVDAVGYELSRWKGQLCSVCELFSSKDIAFVPAGRVVKSGGIEAVESFYGQLGPQFTDALADMYLLDAVICNTDRHFGNFGVLVESHSNKIIAPAPLFDHGNSLFSLAGLEDFESVDALSTYADTQLPRVYDDFYAQAARFLTNKRRRNLWKLLDFQFVNSRVARLDGNRLKAITEVVHNRAAKLLAC